MHKESLPQWADAINGSELYTGVELELTENPCFLKNELNTSDFIYGPYVQHWLKGGLYNEHTRYMWMKGLLSKL